MAGLNFNAQQYQPAEERNFDPLPNGDYPVMITNSEMKPTKSGDGSYLNLELTVQGGEYNNRKVFHRLNLNNPNPQAVEIAQRELSSICHVTGVMQVQDSQQLHGIPFVVNLGIEKSNNPEYSDQNRVRGIKDRNGNKPGQNNAAPQGGPTPPVQQPAQPAQPQQPQQPVQGGWQGQPQQQPPQQNQWQQPAQQAPQQEQYAPPQAQPQQNGHFQHGQPIPQEGGYQPQGTAPTGYAQVEPTQQQPAQEPQQPAQKPEPQPMAQPWNGQATQQAQPWNTPSQTPGQ